MTDAERDAARRERLVRQIVDALVGYAPALVDDVLDEVRRQMHVPAIGCKCCFEGTILPGARDCDNCGAPRPTD